MHVMVLSFAAVIAAQKAPGPLAEEMWPDAKSGRILETPDWSDYRIYPRAALKKDEEGRVKAELFFGSDGKPGQMPDPEHELSSRLGRRHVRTEDADAI